MTTRWQDCQLVIVGGGGSGLAAAVRAREAGLKDVMVLEKTPRPGGNALLAVVMLGLEGGASESDLRASIDQAFRATMEGGRWILNHRLVRMFLEKHPEVVDWLRRMGVPFVVGGFELNGKKFTVLRMPKRFGDYRTTDPSRGPGFTGSVVVERLLEKCRKLGVNVVTNARVTRLLIGNDGEVTGVVFRHSGEDASASADAVVLAAGGFGANKALMAELFPNEFRNPDSINNLCVGASTGDGILMAREIGALIGDDRDAGIVGPGHHPWAYSVHEALLRPETVWVNKRGERFVDESVGFASCQALVRQPDAVMYALLDEELKEYIKKHPNERQIAMDGLGWFATLDEDLKREAAWSRRVVCIADTWEEIASFVGSSPDALKQTIHSYNQFCEQGRDGDFLKEPSYLRPLRTPPFYAILGLRFCHGTAGGVCIDHRLRVIGRNGRVIKGLYATGDNTSGWVAEWHLPGTTLAWAFTSGYMAGENAADYILGRIERG